MATIHLHEALPIHSDVDIRMASEKHRIAFGPRSLLRFTEIIEEVVTELIGDGAPAPQVRSREMRIRLAQRLFTLARCWWTDTQIKQLLLRILRNEAAYRLRSDKPLREESRLDVT